MKWLDRIVGRMIQAVDVKVSAIYEICQKQSKEIGELNKRFNEIETRFSVDEEENGRIQLYINKDILHLREHLENELKRDSLRIDEKESQLRQELEAVVTGLTKVIDKRLEELGDKKGIVTSLLKRIAELEGLVEDKNER